MPGRRVISVVALTSILAASSPARADDDSPDAAYEKARTAVVARLETFGAWCASHGCAKERETAYQSVFAIDPDDLVARKELRYARGADGKWRRADEPKIGPTDPSRAAEAGERRDAAVRDYRDAALAFLLDPRPTPAAHERAIDEFVAVDPECAEARAANHEQKVGERWLLDETVAAKTRRGELFQFVKTTRKDAAPPTSSPATREEIAVVPNCGPVFQNDFVRVVGCPGTKEAEDAARAVAVTRPLFKTVAGVEAPTIPGYRLWIFASPADGIAAMDRDARFDPEARKWFRNLSAGWIAKGYECFIWPADAPTRTELSMRQTLGAWQRFAFGVAPKHGWAWEGVGNWFAEAVFGAHRCFFTKASDYGSSDREQEAMKERLTTSGADWLSEARWIEKSTKWPDFRVMLGRSCDALTVEELVVSYALARYFIEGRGAGELPAVLAAVGKSDAPDTWCASCTGMTLDRLERRLRRWIRETK